jgi:hypothetical protein
MPVTSHTLRHVRRGAVASLAMVALAISLVPSPVTASAEPATPRPRPATPELIERDVRRGAITPAQGALFLTWALTAPARLPEIYVSDTPWSGTLPLLRLRERLPALGDAPAALAARAALRGATFSCPGTSGSLPNVRSTKHFYLQFKASALQALSIRQYANALETAWATEIGRFKWAKPPRDPFRAPPGGRYPVRVEDLGSGLYGYVTGTAFAGDNPSTSWNDRDAVASCMVLNRNFGPFPGTPLDALRATAAHEFNHSIQFGYGALTGFGKVTDVMVEGLATWMEDEVFDSSDDSYNYLWPEFTLPMGRYRQSPYPYWVVFRAMTERFGSGRRNGGEAVIQVFWEQISKGSSTNLAALAKGFKAKRGRLADAYHNASIALRFLVDCSATARRFCLEEGPAYAAATGGGNSDHANLNAAPDSLSRSIPNDFALNWIGLPTTASLDLGVTHDGGKGTLRVSIACRTGGAVTVRPLGSATRSTDATLAGVDLSGCDEASAVISNVKLTDPTPRTVTRTDYTIAIA